MKYPKYILLERVSNGTRFFTLFLPKEDQTLGIQGETWYRILGYAMTEAEAYKKLTDAVTYREGGFHPQDLESYMKSLNSRK